MSGQYMRPADPEMPDLGMANAGLDSVCHRHSRNWQEAQGSSSSCLRSFGSWVLLRQTNHHHRSLAFQELVLGMGHSTQSARLDRHGKADLG